MTNYDYLIIGGGMTAAAAADGIREVDATGTIGMFTAEPNPPYNRPPLSKGLWKGDALQSVWRNTKGAPAEIHLGRRINEIHPGAKQVLDDEGNLFGYKKLLLATGGRPRRLPFDDNQIIYFRTLSDYQRLRGLTETGRRFAIIGGGFIGTEIAAALAMNGKNVVLIFPGQEIGERIFPRDLARYISSVYKQKGVELVPGQKAVASKTRGNERVLTTASGREVIVDGVVAGIGLEPNTELACAIGLKTDNGIVVDKFLRTGDSDIYA
ncbi:MAG TPA: FAD-dependent oxidoreductase, partial [Chthoniobacterales bacterium]|nr:FAD-dependent oxidoreductase [Chthoniobacterales bacterium]